MSSNPNITVLFALRTPKQLYNIQSIAVSDAPNGIAHTAPLTVFYRGLIVLFYK